MICNFFLCFFILPDVSSCETSQWQNGFNTVQFVCQILQWICLLIFIYKKQISCRYTLKSLPEPSFSAEPFLRGLFRSLRRVVLVQCWNCWNCWNVAVKWQTLPPKGNLCINGWSSNSAWTFVQFSPRRKGSVLSLIPSSVSSGSKSKEKGTILKQFGNRGTFTSCSILKCSRFHANESHAIYAQPCEEGQGGFEDVVMLQLLFDLVLFQDNGEDSHRISPSPVVHVRGLCEAVVEADLIDALEKFGPIW